MSRYSLAYQFFALATVVASGTRGYSPAFVMGRLRRSVGLVPVAGESPEDVARRALAQMTEVDRAVLDDLIHYEQEQAAAGNRDEGDALALAWVLAVRNTYEGGQP